MCAVASQGKLLVKYSGVFISSLSANIPIHTQVTIVYFLYFIGDFFQARGQENTASIIIPNKG